MTKSNSPDTSRSRSENAYTSAINSTTAAASSLNNILPPVPAPIKANEAIIDAIHSESYGNTVQPGELASSNVLVFEGRAQPNSSIFLYDNGRIIAQIRTSASGNWVYSDNKFVPGAHDFKVQIVSYSKVNPLSDSFEVSVPQAAAKPIEVYGAIDDANEYAHYIHSGATSNDTTPQFRGQAAANVLVRVFDNDQEIGSVITDRDGRWVYNASLSSGNHNVVFKGSDGSESKAFALTIQTPDAKPISVFGAIDDAGQYAHYIQSGATTNDTTPQFRGEAGPKTLVRVYDNGREIGSVMSGSDGRWVYDAKLDGGNHSLVFKAGAGSDSQPFVLTIQTPDAKPVEISYVIDDAGQYPRGIGSGSTTNDTTPQFNGKAGPNVLVRVYDNGKEIGSVMSTSDGRWVYDAKLDGGNHSLVFKAGAGSDSQPFVLTIQTPDAKPVEISYVIDDAGQYPRGIGSGSTTNDTTPQFNGKAGPNVLVRVYDNGKEIGSVMSTSDGRWVYDAKLDGGNHSLVFKAGAGSDSQPFVLTVQTPDAKPVEISYVIDDAGQYPRGIDSGSTTNDTTPQFNGKAGPNVLVRVYDNGKEIGSVMSTSDGRWVYNAKLTSGNHSLIFKAGAGSESQPFTLNVVTNESQPIEIYDVRDDSNGAWRSVTPGGMTEDTTPTFAGQAGKNVVLYAFNGDVLIGSFTTSSSGFWLYEPTLDVGSYNLIFKTSDGTASAPFSFTITAPEPEVPVDPEPEVPVDPEPEVPVDPEPEVPVDPEPEVPQTPVIDYIRDDKGVGRLVGENETIDDDTPTLFGTAEPGSLVEIWDNDIKIGERRVGASGSWEFTPVRPAWLENGKHSFVIKSSNGTETAPFDIIIHVPVTVDFVSSNDGHKGEGQGETADTTPSLFGTGPKGVIVRLYEGDVEIGSAVTNTDNGNWVIVLTQPLSAGAHAVIAKFGDDNVSNEYAFTITGQDSVEPEVPVTPVEPEVPVEPEPEVPVTPVEPEVPVEPEPEVPVTPVEPEVPVDPAPVFRITQVTDNFFNTGMLDANGVTDDNQPLFSGFAPANTLVRIYDNGIEIASVTANSNGNWAFKPTAALALGEHAFTAGESATSSSEAFHFRVTPADAVRGIVLDGFDNHDVVGGATGYFNRYDSTSDNTPGFSGVAIANSIITINIDGRDVGTTHSDAYGRWSFQTTEALDSGRHVVMANDSGSLPSIPFEFSVNHPSDIRIDFRVYSDEDGENVVTYGATTDDATPLLRGVAGQNIVLQIFDNDKLVGSVLTAEDGRWSFTLDAQNGDHSIVVKGEYLESFAWTFTVATESAPEETQIPELTSVAFNWGEQSGIYLAKGGVLNDARPAIAGVAAAGAEVELFNGTTSLGTVKANENGDWSFGGKFFANGDYNLTAKVGGLTSEPFDFTVDAKPVSINAVAGLFDQDNFQATDGSPIYGSKLVVLGSAEPGAVVQLLTSTGLSLGYAKAGPGGKWYINADKNLAEGDHQLIAKTKGIESEAFTLHITDSAFEAEQDSSNTLNTLGITAIDLLDDAEKTLLTDGETPESEAIALHITSEDLSVTTANGIAASFNATLPAINDDEYHVI